MRGRGQTGSGRGGLGLSGAWKGVVAFIVGLESKSLKLLKLKEMLI